MDSIHDIHNELPRREGNSWRSITVHFFYGLWVYQFPISFRRTYSPSSGDKERRKRIVKRRVRRRPLPQYIYIFFLFFYYYYSVVPLEEIPGFTLKFGVYTKQRLSTPQIKLVRIKQTRREGLPTRNIFVNTNFASKYECQTERRGVIKY